MGFAYRKLFYLFTGTALCWLFAAPVLAGLDAPHNASNDIGCLSCHDVRSNLPKLMPAWTAHSPANIDDTLFNSMCWSCHNGSKAPYVKTHSSLNTSDRYGDWTVECWVCHSLHTQDQLRKYGMAGYLYSAASSGVTPTTLSQTGAGWEEDEFVGMVLVPNTANVNYNYTITDNSSDTLTVRGPMDLSKTTTGNTFGIVLGKLIRSTVNLGLITDPLHPEDKTGYKTVRYFRREGGNSFADGNTTFDGICEICHTETNHFQNDGTSDDPEHDNVGSVASSNCTTCHNHENGFAHGGGSGTGCIECHGHDAGTLYDPDMSAPYTAGSTASPGRGTVQSHSTHTETSGDDLKGPGIYCDTCHDISNFPFFKSGSDANGDGRYNLSETDVCDACHSEGGSYDGLDDPAVGAKTIWKTGAYVSTSDSALQADKQKWCATCHDEDASIISGVMAPNIIGDESGAYTYGTGWGYFKTGHGLAASEDFPSKGGIQTLAGRPIYCDSCHDYSAVHIDGKTRTFDCNDGCNATEYRQSYRLSLVDGQDPMLVPRPGSTSNNNGIDKYRLCVSCHDPGPFTDPANMNTNMRSGGTNYHEYHLGGGMHSVEYPADYNYSGTDNSQINCVICHNVHGSTRPAMIRDGKLISREPGLEFWYTKTGISQTSSLADPQPQDIPLSLSDGQFWWGSSSGNLCSNCHGGARYGTRDPYQSGVAQAPTLNWTGETGYESDGADPDSGSSGSLFTFQALYTDHNNDAPTVMQLWIDRNDDGSYTDNADPDLDEKIDLPPADHADSLPYNGVIYTATIALNSAGDNTIGYRFYASDGTNDATGPATGEGSISLILITAGNNPPRLAWVSESCRYEGVSPMAEVGSSSFDFSVDYTDIDDTPPSSMQVWVDVDDTGTYEAGEKYDLTATDSGDNDYTDGKRYSTSLTLGYAGDGELRYRFVASDGTATAAGDPAFDHVVTVVDPGSAPLTVCASGCDFTTIQGAVDAVNGAHTVLVYAGTYNEQVYFNGADDANTTVQSVCGPNYTTIDASGVTYGVHVLSSSGIKVDGFEITNGTTGVYMQKGGNVSVESCAIHDNNNSGGNGGGVLGTFDFATAGNYVSLIKTKVYSNMALNGAGISLKAGLNSSLSKSFVYNNTATGSGGGAHMDNSSLNVENSVIADNSAGSTGGAVMVDGTLNITNSDIVGNVANGASGGGAFYTNTWNTINVKNSILWDNSAPTAGQNHTAWLSSTTTMTVSDSILANDGDTDFGDYPYFTVSGATLSFSGFISGANPQFVDAANGNYHLKSSSPAIDKGNAVYTPDDDFEGDSRPQGAADDIGADEYRTVNSDNAPALSWTGETNYTTDGVNPDSGAPGSNFVFRVDYTDADNQPPQLIQLWIDLNDDGAFSADEKFAMDPVDSDSDYTDGKRYTKTLSIGFAGNGILNYRFYATDGIAAATGNPTGSNTVTLIFPTVSFTSAAQTTAGESGSATITMQLSAASAQDVTVPFTVNGASTATGDGTDYSIAASPVTIPAGSTTADITVTIAADSLDEDNETVIVDMGTPTNAEQGATTTQTVTITDDDPTPSVTFTSSSQATADESGTATVTVALSAVSGRDVTVPFTINGASTATGGSTDYNITASPVTIPAGSTTADITMTIAGDSLDEDNETVSVDMGTPINAAQGATTTHTVTITDDDPTPTVTFSSGSQATADESGTATITVALSAVSGREVTVPFTVNGSSTAVNPDDYSITASPVTITAGGASANITVTVAIDSIVEGDETVIVDMGAPTNATQGAITQHTLTITDDDVAGGGPVSICNPTCTYYDTIQEGTNAAISGETVLVAAGTYSENITCNKNITIQSVSGPGVTTIQGQSGVDQPVANFTGGNAVLDGFTIDQQETGGNSRRGIVVTGGAAPTVRNCRVRGNTPATYVNGPGIDVEQGGITLDSGTVVGGNGTGNVGALGGGLYVRTTSGGPYAVVIDNSTISYNSGTRGGGIYIDTTFNGTVTISGGATITNNTGSQGYGVGIYAAKGMTISDTDIKDNLDTTATNYGNGGGLYLTGTDQATTFSGGAISGNNAANGGGVYIAGGADLTLDGGAVISGNIADVGSGGGIRVEASGSSFTCAGAYLKGNDAYQYGGAIYNNNGMVSLTNCNVTGNTADGASYSRGGGIYTTGTATLSIFNSTIAGNYAWYSGGGLFHNGGTTTITNTVCWDDTVTTDTANQEVYGSITATYCDVEGGYSGTGNLDLDPLFVTPAAATSGNPTTGGNFHLQAGSPVIDQASATYAPADDIDGDSRPQGIGDDMGADEYIP